MGQLSRSLTRPNRLDKGTALSLASAQYVLETCESDEYGTRGVVVILEMWEKDRAYRQHQAQTTGYSTTEHDEQKPEGGAGVPDAVGTGCGLHVDVGQWERVEATLQGGDVRDRVGQSDGEAEGV